MNIPLDENKTYSVYERAARLYLKDALHLNPDEEVMSRLPDGTFGLSERYKIEAPAFEYIEKFQERLAALNRAKMKM